MSRKEHAPVLENLWQNCLFLGFACVEETAVNIFCERPVDLSFANSAATKGVLANFRNCIEAVWDISGNGVVHLEGHEYRRQALEKYVDHLSIRYLDLEE